MRVINKLGTWFKHNPWTKLAALAAALVSWYLASQVVYLTGRHEVAVELQLAEGMTAVAVSPSFVTVVVEAPAGLAVKPAIRRDLSHISSPGQVVFSLTAADISISPRARVVGIEPGQVEVLLDRQVHRVLPVRVVFDGSPRPGYRLAGHSVEPPEVRVPGPENLIRTMTEIETDPVSLTGRGGEYVFEVETALRPPLPSPPAELEDVLVRVEIAPALKSREFDPVPVGVLKHLNQRDEITVTPREVRVVVRGREDLVGGLAPADVKVFADVAGLAPGSYELPLRSRLPSGVSVAEYDPPTVRVSLGRVPPTGVE